MGSRGSTPSKFSVRGIKRSESGAGELKPKPVIPKCPQYLSHLARKEWKRIVPELDRLGILTCVDGAALEGYCVAYANMVKAQKTLDEKGLTFETDRGYVGQRPEVNIVNKSLVIIKSFCAEFGLTPSARARMLLPGKPEEEDEMDKFLRGG